MSKSRESVEDDILDDELADLEGSGVDLPANIQARLRRHDSQHRLPRERESGEGHGRERSKTHRLRRTTD